MYEILLASGYTKEEALSYIEENRKKDTMNERVESSLSLTPEEF